MQPQRIPLGVKISTDIEHRRDRRGQYRARARWVNPQTKDRDSCSELLPTLPDAEAWVDKMKRLADRGVSPATATMPLSEYGAEDGEVWPLATRGLEGKTMDPYRAGWRLRVAPSLGHLSVRQITNGVVDRAVHSWIADECGRSTVKNSLAILVRVMEQALRDGVIEVNPAKVTGWQKEYKQAEDELDDPRSLALPNWAALEKLADALVARSTDQFAGWGEVVKFAACTATRIGEVSGVRVKDIDTQNWLWDLCRQTTPGPGGLIDKGTKGKRRRLVPLIPEIRPLVERRLTMVEDKPMARLFTGPRGGRISTAVLRDATRWDDVVTALGYEHLRRHDLRHTGLTWMADAGVKVHVLRKIAGHGSLATTQRYLHPSVRSVEDAGTALSAYLFGSPEPDGPQVVPGEQQRRHLYVVE